VIAVIGILIGLFVVPDAWTVPVIAGALLLEVVETYVSLRISRRLGPPRVGPERLIGQTGRVVEACRPDGRVRVRGEVWQARCEAGADVDELVRVIGRDRLVLSVEPAPGARALTP
jgi:membrane protein implicated in regulation of membrane protease activity